MAFQHSWPPPLPQRRRDPRNERPRQALLQNHAKNAAARSRVVAVESPRPGRRVIVITIGIPCQLCIRILNLAACKNSRYTGTVTLPPDERGRTCLCALSALTGGLVGVHIGVHIDWRQQSPCARGTVAASPERERGRRRHGSICPSGSRLA